MRYVIVTEVDVLHVGGGLVVARDVADVGDGVVLRQHPERQRRDEAECLSPLVAHEAHSALVPPRSNFVELADSARACGPVV